LANGAADLLDPSSLNKRDELLVSRPAARLRRARNIGQPDRPPLLCQHVDKRQSLQDR